MDRYFLEPYRFIPPHRGTLWNYLGRPIVSRHIRKNLRVQRWAFSGLEQLREAVTSGAGILLTPNHTRSADPFVLGYMSKDLGHYFYFVASIHLFRASRVRGWLMNRMGAYSIWREGVDRESLRATVNILASAERPVVLFPEGTWFRQNDRVGPLQEGLSLITRQAVRQGKRPILVFPVGIKYWNLTDIQGELRARLSQQEKRLGWKPRSDVPHLERLEKIFEAQIGLNELEYLGQLQSGPTEDRFRMLVESIIQGQEKSHLGQVHEGWHLERIRRLRQHLVRKRQENAGDQDWIARSNRELD
ncbi:MAG: lysophospholipid acyltransferase family protein, partial [Gemmataceae bacterium]